MLRNRTMSGVKMMQYTITSNQGTPYVYANGELVGQISNGSLTFTYPENKKGVTITLSGYTAEYTTESTSYTYANPKIKLNAWVSLDAYNNGDAQIVDNTYWGHGDTFAVNTGVVFVLSFPGSSSTGAARRPAYTQDYTYVTTTYKFTPTSSVSLPAGVHSASMNFIQSTVGTTSGSGTNSGKVNCVSSNLSGYETVTGSYRETLLRKTANPGNATIKNYSAINGKTSTFTLT